MRVDETLKSGESLKHRELTDQIICSFYNVYNTLGYGFLEKLYENALTLELRRAGVEAKAQWPIQVLYRGVLVGDYFADLLVDEKVIVEIKAAKSLVPEHEAQLLNYLKATNIEVGLLLNFGPKAEFQRKVLNNPRITSG